MSTAGIDNAMRKAIDALRLEWQRQGNNFSELGKDAVHQLEEAFESHLQAQQRHVAYDSLELHVTHSIVAGALYDFMGWLTSRRTRICLSDTDNASPAVDAIVDFSKMRGLMLEDAQVESWQKVLVEPPAREPLTDERIDEIMRPLTIKPYSWREFARAIEAAHGIRGNA